MNRTPLWHFAVIVVICVATFANTLSGAFLWDDQTQIVKNPNVRTLSSIPAAFTEPFWGFLNPGQANRSNFYRPTQSVLYAVAYWWNGLDPVPFHVVNLALHVLASLFVYLVCIELGMAAGLALLAAGLFAAHPIHSEAIAWIASTPDLACGVFYFAALWTFLKSKTGADKRWFFLSVLLFFPALLSKEMAITLPLIVLVTTYLPSATPLKLAQRLGLMIPYGVVAAIYLGMRVHALGFLATTHTPLEMGLFDWITLGIQVFGRYIWYAILPYPLIAYHQVPAHFPDRVLPGVLALISIVILSALIWRVRKRFPEVALWCAAFPLFLIPVFYLKGISTAVMADRYLYIPSIAVVIILVTLLSSLLPQQTLVVGGSLVALLAFASVIRNRDWQDGEHIFSATLDRDPNVGHMQLNLAEILLGRGDDANAAIHLTKGLDLLNSQKYAVLPDDLYRAQIGIGAVFARARNYKAAREHLEAAQQLVPDGDWPHLYLGGISMEADNDIPKAIEQFQTAIRLGPLNEVARDYLGVAYFNQGKFQEAKTSFEEALKINPTFQDARKHLALAEQSLRQPPATP
jgi:tetratricopeptide (TPR) repeat protein